MARIARRGGLVDAKLGRAMAADFEAPAGPFPSASCAAQILNSSRAGGDGGGGGGDDDDGAAVLEAVLTQIEAQLRLREPEGGCP